MAFRCVQVMDTRQLVHKLVRYRDSPVMGRSAALLKRMNDNLACWQINAVGGEIQGFGNTAAGVIEQKAQGAQLRGLLKGSIIECPPFFQSEVQAFALGVIK